MDSTIQSGGLTDLTEAAKLLPTYLELDFSGRKEGTLYNNLRRMKKFFTWAANRGHNVVSHDVLTRYVNWVYDNHPASTASEDWWAVRRFLRWLERSGRIVDSIERHVRLPRKKKVNNSQPITHEEYLQLRVTASGHWMDWVIMLGWHTGMSLIDCLSLKWEHVDLDKCCILRERRKTGVPLMVPFEPDDDLGRGLSERLASYPDAGPGDFVDPASAAYIGNPINPSLRACMAFTRIRDRAGVSPAKTFHSFRHSFVSMLANSQVNTALASKITGHSNPSIFLRYVHPNIEQARTQLLAAKAASGFMRNVPTPDAPRYGVKEDCIVWKPERVYMVKQGQDVRLPDGEPVKYVITGPDAEGKLAIVLPCNSGGEVEHNIELLVDIRSVRSFK
jgi:integrase